MSLTIIKAGILDSIQDEGRFGYQASGINPGGAMDLFSARLANCLLGKPMAGPVIEIHFPAPEILFTETACVCITGADFTPAIGGFEIQMNQPVVINKGSLLHFNKLKRGARSYLSVLNTFIIPKWLNSFSTNITAGGGGISGSALRSGDAIPIKEMQSLQRLVNDKPFKVLPWRADPRELVATGTIAVTRGSEWDWLDRECQEIFLNNPFHVTMVADRMGYRLSGKRLKLKVEKQLVSSAVTFGTIQLLPSRQLIVLMADHQTTGGYPRIANVITAHLPFLAQCTTHDGFSFTLIDIEEAEKKMLHQFQYLKIIKDAAAFKVDSIL